MLKDRPADDPVWNLCPHRRRREGEPRRVYSKSLAFAFFRPVDVSDGKLSGQAFHKGVTGAPILADAPGVIECRVHPSRRAASFSGPVLSEAPPQNSRHPIGEHPRIHRSVPVQYSSFIE